MLISLLIYLFIQILCRIVTDGALGVLVRSLVVSSAPCVHEKISDRGWIEAKLLKP